MPTNNPLDFANAPPSPPQPVPVRHPLGLPAGSVRAVIALMVAGLIWALIFRARNEIIEVPLYLVYLMFLITGSFFAAHGNSIAAGQSPEPSPLHLPRGTLRWLLVLGFVGTLGWYVWKWRDFPDLRIENPGEHPYLIVWMLGAFFLGMLVDRIVDHLLAGPAGPPAAYQDVLAWVSLLAVIGLAIEVVVLLMINPTLEGEKIHLPKWETFLSAIISFYFGARS